MDTIAGARKSEQFSALLDHAFGLSPTQRFLEDFPVWDERLGPGIDRLLRIGVWQGDSLVSCAGVRLAELHAPVAPLKVALIGAVATHESHRGTGLASRTVSLALQWARERGAALGILWGPEAGLYSRLGFEAVGTQVRIAVSRLRLSGEGAASGPLGRGWVPGLMECLKRRGSGLVVGDQDAGWVSAHRNVQWYWLGPAERPVAYAALGRGIDLQGIIHEWGGSDVEAVHSLLGAVRAERPEAQLLASPDLLPLWGLEPGLAAREPVCLARCLDAEALLLAHGTRVSAGDPILSPTAAACRAIFDPNGRYGLPLWIWGLDAV